MTARAHAWAGALLVLGTLGPHAVAGAQPRDGTLATCPDITGHYRMEGDGPVRGDAVKALNAETFNFLGSELRISGSAAAGLGLAFKAGETGRLPALPQRTLHHGVDFTCQGGWVVLSRKVPSSRKTEQAWYEGESVVQLRRAQPGGLTLLASFSGSQRSTLYQYDSARISLPKLGTGVALREQLRWPDASEPLAVVPKLEAPPPEPREVVDARRLLSSQLLGPVVLATVQPRGDAVAATFKATRSEHVVQLEDRLQAAGIAYAVQTQPVWSSNTWHLVLLIRRPSGGAPPPWRPSELRVEHELRRLRHPLAEVDRVRATDDGYLATLQLRGQLPAEGVVERYRAHSTMFAEVTRVGPPLPADTPGAATLQLRLRVR